MGDQKMQTISKNHSIPPISDDHLRLWLHNARTASTISMEDDHHLSDLIQISSSLPSLEKSNSCEFSSLEDVILQGFDNAQFRNKKSINNNVQKRKSSHGGNEGMEGGGEECKRQKKPRSSEVHNMNERLRRKKLAEKMAALQEMIPNSVKRDQASTIDDAIKYIQTLQCLLQMMSADVGHTLVNAPVVMLLQPGQQGIPIPTVAPILQTRPGGNEMCLGMLSSMGYPVGLPRSSATSQGLPPPHSIQNNQGQFLEPMHANSIPCFGSQSSTATKEASIFACGVDPSNFGA